MIHVRIVSPPDLTPALIDGFRRDKTILNVEVLSDPSTHPSGDRIRLDVPNGSANKVIGQLRNAGVVQSGSIVLETIDACLSDQVEEAERHLSRFQAFTPVWELVAERIKTDGLYPPSWFLLLVIAGIIGAAGILTNSQILIVGAMVVGPEYSAMISVANAALNRDGRIVRRGLNALGIGFAGAIVAALLLALLIRGVGHTPLSFERGIQPVANLINSPDLFSVIVAVVAGIVGVISLTESRASTLIGVFVSVTTIPAASDIGVSIVYGDWRAARGSFFQLLLNVTILIVVGVVMMAIQKKLWDRVSQTFDIPVD
jgi:uncharacterized hydrophobic protein (TIGR00271 family)